MTWLHLLDVVVLVAIALSWRHDRKLRRDIEAFLERVRELRGSDDLIEAGTRLFYAIGGPPEVQVDAMRAWLTARGYNPPPANHSAIPNSSEES